MKTMHSKPELLAPAGDFERLCIAVDYGADAVYAGQPQFSLRGRENGFITLDDLKQGIEYAHSHQVRFFLASNTIPHNNKILPFQKSLEAIIALEPDALIMADPGMIHWVHQNFPHVPLHLSVQSSTVNWLSANFWAQQGISRIILGRELRLREVHEIVKQCPDLEIEVFVHGSNCMASSGRCMLSNYMTHRDANQGNCNNTCRFPYHVWASHARVLNGDQDAPPPLENSFFLTHPERPQETLIQVDEDQHGTYFMNARDLCAIRILDQVAQTGVHSLKIEGRTRSPYYLAQVVRAYRLAIDAVNVQNPIPEEAFQCIADTDHRGFMTGFYTDQDPLPQDYSGARSGHHEAEVVAQIRHYNASEQIVTLSVRNQLHEGETLELLIPHQPKTQVIVTQLQNGKRKPQATLHPGLENCTVHLSEHFSHIPEHTSFLIRRIHPKTAQSSVPPSL